MRRLLVLLAIFMSFGTMAESSLEVGLGSHDSDHYTRLRQQGVSVTNSSFYVAMDSWLLNLPLGRSNLKLKFGVEGAIASEKLTFSALGRSEKYDSFILEAGVKAQLEHTLKVSNDVSLKSAAELGLKRHGIGIEGQFTDYRGSVSATESIGMGTRKFAIGVEANVYNVRPYVKIGSIVGTQEHMESGRLTDIDISFSQIGIGYDFGTITPFLDFKSLNSDGRNSSSTTVGVRVEF